MNDADIRIEATVAVTGLNATDNPGPGISVIRALRHHPGFRGRIVGLAYDTLEPGIYARDLVDDVFLIPYPSQGTDALAARIAYIQERVPLDALMPTLDSELPEILALLPELDAHGIGTFLPSTEQLDLRAKPKLAALGESADIPVPQTRVLGDVAELYEIHRQMDFPLVLKGLLYGAHVANSVDEAVAAYYRIVAKWGLPVIAQAFVTGDEMDVLAVGDGQGGLVGAVAMRKTFLTEQGKGWAGITVRDPALLELAERFARASRWRGPCELEVVRDREGGFHLIEINPRFPAWAFLSAAAGANLPLAAVRLALGETVEPLSDCRAGILFVRIALEQIATLEDFQQLATTGELIRGPRGGDRSGDGS